MSVFQVKLAYDVYHNVSRDFVLRNVEYKQSICPLMFNNSNIPLFILVHLVETFYKRNVLSFTKENVNTYKYLKSNITKVILHKLENINLDLKLLNPLVFYQTIWMNVRSESLNSINGAIFRNLKNLLYFQIDEVIFRKINHKQGIKWIRQWNFGRNVNLTKENISYSNTISNIVPRRLILSTIRKNTRKRMSVIFPDEDFCIYVDFPFNQFVILYELLRAEIKFIIKDNEELSCTYLWLIQYYDLYYKNFLIYKKTDTNMYKSIMRVLNSTAFKSISKCNFEEKVKLCNKSNYKIKDIWDESDIFMLSKKIQTAFKIMLYPTAFLGLITNIIVVIVIVKKENADLFKKYKQYSYLYLNSIFCIIIMVIELLSWMTECFYPVEVFCPEIRKLVPIQFFKIIFKECFISMLRLMCSFTYFAFALNRISLIGIYHGKLVTFFSQLGIKVFIGVTILISSSLSWIKGFKYEVNYFFPFLNYPMSTEMDITIINSNSFNDAYFIINFICDLFNYVVFVIICVIIDICMVVQLRRTLEEKAKKMDESMNQKQSETKKAENDDVVNKAIKMVVLNSAIAIFFKLPASFIPLLNVVAEFYYKNEFYKFNHPDFGEFYTMLQDTALYYLIQDISYFLYTLSLSIQIFIYNGFDKKFHTAFDRFQNRFKKSNT